MPTPPSGAPEGDLPKTYTAAELTEHVRAATSKVQQENTLLAKRLETLTAEVGTRGDTEARLKTELDTVRKAASLSDDAEGFVKFATDARAAIESERRQLSLDGRTLRAEKLIGEFPGLTQAELSGMASPEEMEIYALRNHARATPGEPQIAGTLPFADVTAPAANAAPPAPVAEAPKPQPDRGGGGSATGAAPGNLRGQAKVEAGLANMRDPFGVMNPEAP